MRVVNDRLDLKPHDASGPRSRGRQVGEEVLEYYAVGVSARWGGGSYAPPAGERG